MMFKNGLFLVSISLIIAVVSVDAKIGYYDWFSLVTASALGIFGLALIWYDRRKKRNSKHN